MEQPDSDAQYTGTEGTRPYQGVSWFYARYRPRLNDGTIRMVIDKLGWRPTDRLLDLGTGPGQIALRFAPYVAEAVGIDPEPDQLEEAGRRAKELGVSNARFILGSSDDLAALRPDLGMFRAATMGESFHWMLDRDRVLRDLSAMLDDREGAVLLINTGNLVASDERLAKARRLVRRTLDRYLRDVPPGPHPRGRHDPFEAILLRSPFPEMQLLQHEYEQQVEPTLEALLYPEYTISHVLRRLGSKREAFEAEVRAHLASLPDTGPLRERRRDVALVGRRRL